jgi:toxin CcdB
VEQFGLYANQDKDTNRAYPYFVDVQSELLAGLKSRVVIPIIALEKSKSASSIYPQHLCPEVEIQRKKYVLMTHQMTSVPIQMLKGGEGSLSRYRNEIVAAIDFLVTGI